MSFTRVLGQNDKVYRKFGDYCISETDNECYIVCSCCQQEHQCEDAFWEHVREVHNFDPPSPQQQQQQLLTSNCEATAAGAHFGDKIKRETNSPQYIEAEYLENMELNDPQALQELSTIAPAIFNVKAETKDENLIRREMLEICTINDLNDSKGDTQLNMKSTSSLPTHIGTERYLDVEKVPSKHILNGKLIKKLLLQMQQANNDFSYKLNKLTREFRVIQADYKIKPTNAKKRCSPVLPSKPFNTRDEVLTLDRELHKSKEMRDCLTEEVFELPTGNPDQFCRMLWSRIMTNEVSNQFCWRGVYDNKKVIKHPVKNLTLLDVFQAAFRLKFSSSPISCFKQRTVFFFNKSNERMKRQRMLDDERRQYEEDNSDSPSCGVADELLGTSLDLSRHPYKRSRISTDHDDSFEEVYC